MDYSETYSPVGKIHHYLVGVISCYFFNWVIRQLDIKNAFLHGLVTEEIYMRNLHIFFIASTLLISVVCIKHFMVRSWFHWLVAFFYNIDSLVLSQITLCLLLLLLATLLL